MKATFDPIPCRMKLTLWLLTPLLTGAVIMSLELAAFRLYAPYFGYSIYVWGSMISVVMVALAAGYAVGGRFADRCNTDLSLYLIILSSALYQFAAVYATRSLLPWLAEFGEFSGVSLATAIIFAPPIIALALVGPYVIRLLARSGHIGAAAGKVYALSTVGSVAGILATSFYLIPKFGTQATLMAAAFVSALAGMSGFMGRGRVALLAILPIAALPVMPRADWSMDAVWTSESAYNLVRVVREGKRLTLVLNDERSAHTIRDEANDWTGYYYDEFALGPLLVEVRKALVLGMGAGSSITTMRLTAPDASIDAVEIDEKVVEAGSRFFGLDPDGDRLRIHVADARPWLAKSRELYDLIQVDLYQGGPYIPFYLATEEFFQQVRAHMSEGGLMMINVFDVSRDGDLLMAMAATLKRVFTSVTVLPTGTGNHLVMAFAKGLSAASIRDLLNKVNKTEKASRLAQRAASKISDLDPPAGTPVFTDDHAPVEEITRRMLENYQASSEPGF